MLITDELSEGYMRGDLLQLFWIFFGISIPIIGIEF